mmetsp:Transcript_27313/g.89180  ORF Transcript_27313/g.89180 Transcript_27313/m.89180 type:complete len:91 (-) Transcript_27313:216-488(-)
MAELSFWGDGRFLCSALFESAYFACRSFGVRDLSSKCSRITRFGRVINFADCNAKCNGHRPGDRMRLPQCRPIGKLNRIVLFAEPSLTVS